MIKSSIPKRAEQGSSAALLSALLLAILPSQRTPLTDPPQLADIIQDAQARINRGGPGARIDAMTCLLAENPSHRHTVIRYSSQPCELVGHVPLPPHLRILALDTGHRNTALETTLQELQVAGAMGLTIIETIYRDLGQPHTPLHGYLANTSPLLYRQYFRALLPKRLRGSDFLRTYGVSIPSFPGNATLDPAGIYRVRTAVDHLIAENEHAEQFLQALEELSETTPSGRPVITDPEERQRTLQRAGRLALASHHSYRLRLELSCPEADWIVDKLMEAGPDKGIYGARITGAGGGGTVMALVDDSPAAGDAVLQTIQDYPHATGRTLSVLEAGAPGSSGALLSDLT